MPVGNFKLDAMCLWVKTTMKVDKLYPIASDEAREALIQLYQENSCPELGFRDNEKGEIKTVYKIDYDFLMSTKKH